MICLKQICIAFVFLHATACIHKTSTPEPAYVYNEPDYKAISLHVQPDSIHFQLSNNTYNEVKSFNTFISANGEYIVFYDDRSGTVNFYNLNSHNQVKRLKLKKYLPDEKLYKTSVYCFSFDSIFVVNNKKIYLMDSSGKVINFVKFKNPQRFTYLNLQNTTPLIVKENMVYACIRPYVKESSIEQLKKWKIIYGLDFKSKNSLLAYNFPKMYWDSLFGYHFLDYKYCIDKRGFYVFSFPADTLIYQTDLVNYHNAYYAKSSLQMQAAKAVSEKELELGNGFKHYLLSDSYGPIYFDPSSTRYLRVVKSGISAQDYGTKKWKRNQRLIIFDSEFHIKGESPIDSEVDLDFLFITLNGEIYARINAKDEYALHFVKLAYNYNLTQKEISKK